MNSDFNNIYENLYSDYVFEFGFPRKNRVWATELESETELIRIIRRSIENTELELSQNIFDQSVTFRPDAKFFLLTNFHLMIVRPLQERKNTWWDQTKIERNYSEDIKSDIRKIMSFAADTAKAKQKKIVSGHEIMKAIDQNWKQLKLTSLEIWGDDE